MTDTATADVPNEEPKKPTPRKGTAAKPKPKVEPEVLASAFPEGKAKEEPEDKVGDLVLYVTDEDQFRPALLNRLNEDSTWQITVFNSEGAVFLGHVEHGSPAEIGTFFYNN